MNPTKKTAAKRVAKKRPAKKAYKSDSVLGKLIQLKYRINEWRELEGNTSNTKKDRDIVFELINKAKYNNEKISKSDMKIANQLWGMYERY
tara:strand:+ start:2930 stop:3202 length:273 start_codon:yes stop_codon:yes gene_type:complete